MTEIRPEWLLELAPDYHDDLRVFTYDEMRRALQGVLDEETGKSTKRTAGYRDVRR